MKLKDVLFTLGMLMLGTFLSFILVHIMDQNLVNVALIHILVLIIISRYTSGYWYGIITCFVSIISMNYSFTYPFFEINFTLKGYPITFLEMLAISLITSTITSHMIQQTNTLAERDRQLMEAEKEKMRANLLRAVSHDLRTPLTSIIGTTNSLLENRNSMEEEEKIELTRNIYNDANWLLNMVENLLSITRIDNESAKVTKTQEAVEEVVSEAVTRLKKRLPKAEIHVHIPNEFLMIPMDAILIEQVIINLLENAIIHSQTKKPVDFQIISKDTCVSFHIIDYGTGISEDTMTNLFHALPQGATQVADGKRGMGIGLSICKSIILAHNGTISARNHGSGAEFIFDLPKEE